MRRTGDSVLDAQEALARRLERAAKLQKARERREKEKEYHKEKDSAKGICQETYWLLTNF